MSDLMDIPQLARGMVWCTTCGRSESVKSSNCMQRGWPKCCGYTMTIDGPEEREKEKRRSKGNE